MTPWNPHAARSRWFTAPLADVTPRERALLDELAGAVAWAEGLEKRVQVGWSDDNGLHSVQTHDRFCPTGRDCQPVYVVREAR